MKRFRKSALALVLALLMALQGTEPIFVQAKEAIEDVQKNADFSRPEALTEEEAGITDSTCLLYTSSADCIGSNGADREQRWPEVLELVWI